MPLIDSRKSSDAIVAGLAVANIQCAAHNPLAGWDRLGWQGGWAEVWMRLHDRRALIGAVVLLAGYAALVLTSGLWAAHWMFGTARPATTASLDFLMSISGMILLWRLAVRCAFVTFAYGWREGSNNKEA